MHIAPKIIAATYLGEEKFLCQPFQVKYTEIGYTEVQSKGFVKREADLKKGLRVLLSPVVRSMSCGPNSTSSCIADL